RAPQERQPSGAVLGGGHIDARDLPVRGSAHGPCGDHGDSYASQITAEGPCPAPLSSPIDPAIRRVPPRQDSGTELAAGMGAAERGTTGRSGFMMTVR